MERLRPKGLRFVPAVRFEKLQDEEVGAAASAVDVGVDDIPDAGGLEEPPPPCWCYGLGVLCTCWAAMIGFVLAIELVLSIPGSFLFPSDMPGWAKSFLYASTAHHFDAWKQRAAPPPSPPAIF